MNRPAAFMIFLVLGSGAQAEESDQGKFTYAVGGAKTFQPFALEDFTNPATGKAYLPNERVEVEVGGHVTLYSSAVDFVQTVNDTERELARIGKSLRDGDIKVDAHTLTNPNLILGQLGGSLGLSVNKLRTKILPALAHCDLVDVTDFDIDAKVSSGLTGERQISLADAKPMTVKSFVDKVNDQQRFLCQIGYSFVNRAALRGAGAVEDLMGRRRQLMSLLGITDAHPIFNFSVMTSIKDAEAIAKEVLDGVAALRNPTPARLYDLARKASSHLPEELRLPDIPTIPSPVVPKRPNLALKKSKTWDKLRMGSPDFVEAHVNAFFEVNGSETEEEIRTQGKAGCYVLKRELSLIEANAYMDARQDSVTGHLEASVLGQVLYNPKIDKQLSYHWGNDKAYELPLPAVDYTQPFVIGVVPAFVTFGLKGEVGLGWSAGLTLLSATASTTPYADVKAYGIGAAGIKDLLELGAKGEILVLHDTAIIQAASSVKFDEDAVPRLELSLTGDNSFSMLDGRFFAYVKADALTAISKAFPGVVNMVNDVGSAVDRAAQKVADGVDHASNQVAKLCGWSSPLYVNGLGQGVGYFSFDDVAKSLTYYQEFEIYAAHGTHSRKTRFLNYRIKITPFGTTLDGDSVDNTDREEASLLNQVLSLQEQEIAVANLANDVARKEAALFSAVDLDVNAPLALQVQGDVASTRARAVALDGDRDDYLKQLSEHMDRASRG